MTARVTLLALSLSTLGCSAAHPSEEVRTGIYELVAEPEREGCTPERAAGALGQVGVLVREGGALDAPVPAVGPAQLTAPRITLAPERSFHAETNRRVPSCEGAWVHETWTLMAAEADGFTLLHAQDWRGLSSCAAPSGMPDAPQRDCTSERTLSYRLRTSCRAPCALRVGAGGAIRCDC